MNAKTVQQIENLKNQTIGVEVEMNSITREKAAKIAADFFGTGRYTLPDIGFAESIAKKLAAVDPEKYTQTMEKLSVKAERAAQRRKEQLAHEKNVKRGGKKHTPAKN